MAKISRDDRDDLEQILDRTGVKGLFEALAEEAWQDNALGKRWSKLATKFDKLAQSVDDPY